MKGVIIAGGEGTRLRPLTNIINKHLLPVYDRPMIEYPIETLKDMGITDILITTGKNDVGDFAKYLGDGSRLGVNITYKAQNTPRGIADALMLAEDFVGDQFAVILGDNIFEVAPSLPPSNTCGAVLKKVKSPERFGVFQDGKIVEKPSKPKSDKAVTGFYFYTKEVFDLIKELKPSKRGELEITDLNNLCIKKLKFAFFDCVGEWFDAGTIPSLAEASDWARNDGDSIRTEGTIKSLMDKKNKHKTVEEALKTFEVVQEYRTWTLYKNNYPYDKIAQEHYLLFPKRKFKNGDEMNAEEYTELVAIKDLIGDCFGIQAFIENTDARKSIPDWWHLHVIKWKKIYDSSTKTYI